MSQRYLVLQGPARDLRGSAAAFQVLAAEAFNGSVSPTNSYTKRGRLPGRQQVLHHPGTPPRHNGRLRPGSPPGGPDGRLRCGAEHARCLPGGRSADGPNRPAGQGGGSGPGKLDSTLDSLQTTIEDRLIATADQAHAAAEPRSSGALVVHRHRPGHRRQCVAFITRRPLRVEREQADATPSNPTSLERTTFESSLQTALEMSRAEPSVFEIVAEALTRAAPAMRSELLLADSSKAHFRQVLVSSAQADNMGCGSCPPTTARRHRGHGTWCSPTAPPSTPVPTCGAGIAPPSASR